MNLLCKILGHKYRQSDFVPRYKTIGYIGTEKIETLAAPVFPPGFLFFVCERCGGQGLKKDAG